MTANNILEKYVNRLIARPGNIIKSLEHCKSVPEWDIVIEAMQEFAKLKCKEQREICMQEYTKGKFRTDIAYNILNAPEPEMQWK